MRAIEIHSPGGRAGNPPPSPPRPVLQPMNFPRAAVHPLGDRHASVLYKTVRRDRCRASKESAFLPRKCLRPAASSAPGAISINAETPISIPGDDQASVLRKTVWRSGGRAFKDARLCPGNACARRRCRLRAQFRLILIHLSPAPGMIKQVFCAKHFGRADVEPSRMRLYPGNACARRRCRLRAQFRSRLIHLSPSPGMIEQV